MRTLGHPIETSVARSVTSSPETLHLLAALLILDQVDRVFPHGSRCSALVPGQVAGEGRTAGSGQSAGHDRTQVGELRRDSRAAVLSREALGQLAIAGRLGGVEAV